MDLAIVIPAYKNQYLEATLLSIANQTNKNFNVYIGDDNSPNELYNIIRPFEPKLNLVYKKFDTNLGRKNLTAHWDRCVAMTANEKWVWLFSDDDIMDKDCVSRFHQTLSSTSSHYDLYRFNTKVIDNKGNIVSTNSRHPEFEPVDQFITDKLLLKRSTYIVDHIFSKEKFLNEGGFVNFPLGWSSDEATWFNLGYSKGIYTIGNAYVYWRYSFTNISSLTNLGDEKIEATLQYLVWLKNWINSHYPPASPLNEIYQKTQLNWLKHQLCLLGRHYSIANVYRLSILLKRRLSVPTQRSFFLFASVNYKFWLNLFKASIRNFLKFTHAKR